MCGPGILNWTISTWWEVMALAFSVYRDSCNWVAKSCTYGVLRRDTGSCGARGHGPPMQICLLAPELSFIELQSLGQLRVLPPRRKLCYACKHAVFYMVPLDLNDKYRWFRSCFDYLVESKKNSLNVAVCLIYFTFHARGTCSQCYKYPGLWAWWMVAVSPNHTFRSSCTIDSWKSRGPWRTWLTLIV